MSLAAGQGTKMRTGGGGAEFYFDNGSTIRIPLETAIDFPQLSLRDSGGKVSTVEVKKGTAYVDYSNSKNDEFAVVFGQQKIVLSRTARMRVRVDNTGAAVAVFKGDVQIENPSGTFAVKKNQTANFDSSDNDRYKLAK